MDAINIKTQFTSDIPVQTKTEPHKFDFDTVDRKSLAHVLNMPKPRGQSESSLQVSKSGQSLK